MLGSLWNNIGIHDDYSHNLSPLPLLWNQFFQLTIQFYDRTFIINPCLDSSIRFVEKLVEEVKQMHDDAGVPLSSYHFGGVSEVSQKFIQVNARSNPPAGFMHLIIRITPMSSLSSLLE